MSKKEQMKRSRTAFNEEFIDLRENAVLRWSFLKSSSIYTRQKFESVTLKLWYFGKTRKRLEHPSVSNKIIIYQKWFLHWNINFLRFWLETKTVPLFCKVARKLVIQTIKSDKNLGKLSFLRNYTIDIFSNK